MQKQFVQRFTETIKKDASIIGAAIGGSWITEEIDEYSDVDIVLVTKEKIGGNKNRMMNYASRFGQLLSGFTGEHVGEPRLLICLYDDPLLHVDLKFVTLQEFENRAEDPVIVHDTNDQLRKVITNTKASYPMPGYQWIEDRFWTWVHYAVQRIARGEYFEALDFISSIRSMVLGPLIHIYRKGLPRGVRKIDLVHDKQLEMLKNTVASPEKESLKCALSAVIDLYKELRTQLYGEEIRNDNVEIAVMKYFKKEV